MKIKFSILILFMLCSNAYSLQSFHGKVIIVEPTYMPDLVVFHMDTGNATCPAGTQLKWDKNDENNKVVYSMLLAAYMSGKKVLFHMNDNDSSCKGTHIHLRES